MALGGLVGFIAGGDKKLLVCCFFFGASRSMSFLFVILNV